MCINLKKLVGCKEDYWNDKYNESLNIIEALNNRIEELENEEEINVPPWLDTSEYPYKPFISIEEGKTTLEDPRDIYTSSVTLGLIAEKWKGLPLNQKLMNIWHFVIDALKYRYDVKEDWQFPIVTYYMKFGDCEDGSILFVELARLAGISPERVFNACGWFTQDANKFGHSFPIAQMEDGKWYVFESTLDYKPDQLMLFKGSNYDASWGVANWALFGKIRGDDQL